MNTTTADVTSPPVRLAAAPASNRLRGSAFLAEWTRLSQPRVWIAALATSAVYAAVVTWVLIGSASETARGAGMSIQSLSGAGGGTRAVTTAMAFSSVLLLAMFVGMSAGSFAKGTWRAALLHHPGRLTLAGGTFMARMAMLTVIAVVLFAVGWVTALIVAPGQGISTDSWLNAESWRIAGEDFLRVLGFAAGWALLGTAVGMITRSVPVGLAVAVLWAGPIENVLGDVMDFGQRWFPGLLLRNVVTPENSEFSNLETYGTLGVYAVILMAIIGLVATRRDVSS